MGRFASRAFAWNKDGSESCAATSAAVARTSRTLLRALLAMLIAASTLLAMLILPPVKQANAGQVYWDKFGNAVVAADHSNLGSAFVNMKTGDCTKYELDKGTCKDEYYPIVEPGKGTNGRTKITFRGVFNPLLDKNRFNTRPVFYLITPRGLVDDTIRITREVKWITLQKVPGKNIPIKKPQDNWDNKSNGSETVGQFYNPGKQRYTYLPSDGDKYNHFWDVTLGDKGCGTNRDSMCELYAWKNRGEIGRIFQSWERGSEAVYRWTVTADVDPRYDPYQLFFAMGYTDDKNENVENASSVRHYTVSGPYDTDGDGIPDFEEYNMGDRPDHGVDQTTKGGMKYDEVNNVEPFTSSESKNYFETGTWDGDTVNGHFVKDGGKTYKLPTKAGLVYSFEGEPTDEKGNKVKVTYDDNYGTAHTLSPGHAWLDPLTGHVSFNPGPEHKRHTITFHVQVKYPDPSLYNCKHKREDRLIEHLQAKFKVEPMSRFYYPEWDNTTVTAGSSKQSTEPHSKKDDRYGTKCAKKLPAKSFTLEKYGKYGQEPLKWSSLTNGGDKTGKVTFSPEKPMDAGDYKTPVVVTYLDGSTSADPDSGNGGNPVYAPVTVTEPTVNDGDMHLDLHFGNGLHDENIGGYYNDSNLAHLKKNNPIDKNDNKKGVVLDSWSTNAKGKIDFRAICHKEDSAGKKSGYKFLKPEKGKEKAEGDIAGLKFMDFHQWGYSTEEQEKECNKNNSCSANPFKYKYLTINQRNSNTMERSRALIGGKPNKGGDYVCKVFAFHENDTTLNNFDKNKAAPDILDSYTGDSKKTAIKTFKFHVDVPDNQKYNPTYVKTGTIEAGKFKIGDFVDSNGNSSKQPTSIKNGNGVPTKDQDDIVVDRLPKGTWFEIKRLIKSADKDNNKAKTYHWANLEGDEDNVKRDDKGNPVKKDNKIQPNDTTSTRDYGAITFRPDKWQDAGEYWAEVVVHYPDGTSTDQPESINYKHPVYAKVNVTRDDKNNQFRLDLWKNYPKTRMGNGYDLKVGESLPNDATFDSWMTKSVGNLHQHVVCSKKGKDGKYSDYTYNTLPGHVNNTKSNKDSEKDGLRFKSEKVWKHASFKQQEQCRIKGGSSCDKDNYLYDRDDASEQTRGSFGGKAQKTGDYECKVYVIRGDDKSAAFKKAVEANIANNKKNKKNADPVDGVLNARGNPYGTDGQGYKIGIFDVRIHNLNHFYNPQYNTITLTAGTNGSSAVPQSAQKANGATDNQSDVKAGNLPAGTWFERKMYKSDTSYKSLLSYAVFENGQANTEDKKNAKDTKNAGKFGKVSFYPHKWMNATPEGKPDKVPVVVHYPDGSTSDDPDSGNNGKPIYAYVNIVRPKINNPDLKLELFSRYNDATDNTDGQKIAASYDSNNNINSQYGVTVMKNLGLIKDLGINAWSENKPGQIGFKLLCRKKGDSNSKWNEKLDKLFFHVSKEKKWGHADSFDKQKPCRENSSNCKADLLYDKDGNTMERSRGTIAGVPTEVGEYQCAVLALKPDAERIYSGKLARPKNSNVGGDSSLNVENPANDFGKLVKNVDWAIVYFPVHVVEPFNLPKTGGEDCVNWNMLMSVVCVIGTGAMAAGFFLDQTKWGRAMLEALLRKAMLRKAARGGLRGSACSDATVSTSAACSTSGACSTTAMVESPLAHKCMASNQITSRKRIAPIKAFIRKTAEWCGGVMLRIEWWITERWRC